MNRRTLAPSLTIALVLGAATAGAVQAGGPTRVTDSYMVRFFDDFIFELCEIETFTTLTERWTLKEFPDGSATLHVVRTFVPDDSRIPIEKGAATSFIRPDGSRTVAGSATRLFDPDGGITLIDAGRVELDEFDNVFRVSGQLTSFGADLASYYCP